jgi:hypothetical protein
MMEKTKIMEQQSAARVVVTVDEREWIAVSSLSGAGANDAVYVLDRAAGTITFGDGINGARPPTGSTVSVSYQYGGGAAGNISKRIDDESQLTEFWVVTRADAQMVGWRAKPRSC